MNFIVDAQLPKSLSDFLKRKEHNSIHTLELDDKNKTRDNIIIELAEKENRVVITKDYDFLQSHTINNKPSQLLLVKTGNIVNEELIDLFEQHIEEIVNFLQDYNLIEMYTDKLIVQ
jgi:predicted nuclease of predicted toxin-antitoxin system